CPPWSGARPRTLITCGGSSRSSRSARIGWDLAAWSATGRPGPPPSGAAPRRRPGWASAPTGSPPARCRDRRGTWRPWVGGDGSRLRAAEFARPVRTPLIGVNLGHIGVLAEAELDGLAETVERRIERRYTVEERMTVDVVARSNGTELARTWALNEATVEKG